MHIVEMFQLITSISAVCKQALSWQQELSRVVCEAVALIEVRYNVLHASSKHASNRHAYGRNVPADDINVSRLQSAPSRQQEAPDGCA